MYTVWIHCLMRPGVRSTGLPNVWGVHVARYEAMNACRVGFEWVD